MRLVDVSGGSVRGEGGGGGWEKLYYIGWYSSLAWGVEVSCVTNNAITSKAHEEGGDLISSERLASAFLTLGIAEISDDETINESVDESEPISYKAPPRSPQAKRMEGSYAPEVAGIG